MGRYTSYQKQQGPVRRGEIHPVMRGIGCVLFAIVPLLSYGLAVLLVDYGVKKGWPIPPDWLGTPHIYPLLLKLQGLQPVWNFISSQRNLTANLFFALAFAIVIFGVISIIYGILFRVMGPPQYGPTDAPPIRVKVKRYKR
jgi:hypothetical protein